MFDRIKLIESSEPFDWESSYYDLPDWVNTGGESFWIDPGVIEWIMEPPATQPELDVKHLRHRNRVSSQEHAQPRRFLRAVASVFLIGSLIYILAASSRSAVQQYPARAHYQQEVYPWQP